MKTAVSLPDELFQQADRMARKLGVPRSRLFATALEEYLARHRDRHITARLDRVYEHESSALPPPLRRAQARTLRRESW
ncbi:MAG TPA: ribbon-helix-helix domain-containing protein [Terriglobales bacterium]|jgi:metal-responsive CopG/Arc/MetJ family transcriptional regulator